MKDTGNDDLELNQRIRKGYSSVTPPYPGMVDSMSLQHATCPSIGRSGDPPQLESDVIRPEFNVRDVPEEFLK